MKKLKIGDLFLIVAIIAVSVFIALFNTKQGVSAVVEADGKVIKQLSLNSDCEFIYEGEYKSVIAVKNGQVFVKNSTCPDKSCVLSGKISTGGSIICCLPNRLIVRVEGVNKKVDVISG